MAENQKPLQARMEAADRVRIVSPGTDLSFRIKDIPVVPCAGGRNIPDGEIFTAPVRDSVNGVITYNTATRYQGSRSAMAALPMGYAVYIEGAGWKELPRWAQAKIEAIAKRRSRLSKRASA